MTPDDRFIQQLESYLDDYEGPTELPESVRQAVRARVPRTKQTGLPPGPVRYMNMTLSKAAPFALAAAAAILAVAVGAYVVNRQNVGGPNEASPSPLASASLEPSAEACSATTVTGRSGGVVDVVWCRARADGETVAVPFSLEAPFDWFTERYGDVNVLWLRPADGGAIAFTILDAATVDEALAEISAREGYALENQAPTTIGGADGVVVDVSLAAGAASGDAPPLIDGGGTAQPWLLAEGSPTRAWIVDKDGEITMIVTGEELADPVGEALSTLVWGD